MIANVLLVSFLLLSIALWGHYGLFSGFLHLLVTISCAALAFALWEPLVLGVLIHRMPFYAWGVGLLGPFVLLLVGARALQDNLVKLNMRFENLTNIVGGGFCGFLSGVLTSGLVIISVGLLPLGQSIFGYKPIDISPDGTLEGRAGNGLLFPVDRWTASFFEALSDGAFHPTGGTPLARYQPHLADRAVLNRTFPVSKHSSPTVHPDSITVEHVSSFGTADLTDLIGNTADATVPLLLVSTVWNAAAGKGTFDTDGRLRLAPSQIRLVTSPQFAPEEPVELHRPEGVVLESGQALRFSIEAELSAHLRSGAVNDAVRSVFAHHRTPLSAQASCEQADQGWRITDRDEMYHVRPERDKVNVYGKGVVASRFDSDKSMAYTQQQVNARFVWVFRVPEERVARVIMLRTLSVPLPEPLGDVDERQRDARFVEAFYSEEAPEPAVPPQPMASQDPSDPTIEAPHVGATQHGGGYGDDVEVSSDLPKPVNLHHIHIHKLLANSIVDGDAEVPAPRAGLSRKTRLQRIYTAPDEYLVRVHVGRENAMSLFGRAKQFAATVSTFYMQDSSGVDHHAIGFVWLKQQSGAQHIKIDRIGSLQHISQLPLRSMRQDDELYLYFAIPRNVAVHKLVVGGADQPITGIGPPPEKSDQ